MMLKDYFRDHIALRNFQKIVKHHSHSYLTNEYENLNEILHEDCLYGVLEI